MTNYEKGRRLEYQVRHLIEKSGDFVVRQAKSSFPDLIAVRKSTGKIICIECKWNKYLTQEEKTELIRLWVKYGIHPFLAYKEKRKLKFKDLLFNEDVNTI
jgi:Holliday junction resolvase